MSIEQSKDHLTHFTGWAIDESTFQTLDDDKCVWIARVMTTHHKKAHEEAKKRAEDLPPGIKIDLGSSEEYSFVVLVQGFNHFTLNDEHLSGLLDWCLKHAK